MASTDLKTGGKNAKPVASDTPRQRTAGERDVGTALRAAYQRAVDEKVPPEMLDLLGKLS